MSFGKGFEVGSVRLKIPVSAVQFRPSAPKKSKRVALIVLRNRFFYVGGPR